MTATPRSRTSATALVNRDGPLPSADDPLLGFAPVPHVAARRNSITPDRQRKFIAHLAATGIVTQAAKHVGASMEALYKLRKKPGAEEFDAAWDAAVERGVARLEDCALARAIEGEERMVVSAGQVVGTERRHNDNLTMFFLRHRRPDRYAAQIGSGHPAYERIREQLRDEVEAEMVAEIEERYADWAHGEVDRLSAILGASEAHIAVLEARLAEREGRTLEDGRLTH